MVFLRPVPQRLSHEDALILAAWLVAMVADDEQWDEIRKGVASL